MLIRKLDEMVLKDDPRDLISYLKNFFEDEEIKYLKDQGIVYKANDGYWYYNWAASNLSYCTDLPLRGEKIKEPIQVKGIKSKDNEKCNQVKGVKSDDDEEYTIDDIKDLFDFFGRRLGLDIDDTEPDDEDEINEDAEALQLCRSMLENKDCGLTFLQLWGLIDDILLKNISFNDSGIHFYDLLKLVDRYSNQ